MVIYGNNEQLRFISTGKL